MKKFLNLIIILLIILIILFTINFIRNINIINNAFNTDSVYAKMTDYYVCKTEDSEKQEIYNNDNYILFNIYTNEVLSSVSKYNKTSALLETYTLNNNTSTSTIVKDFTPATGINYGMVLLSSAETNKNAIIKSYLLKPILCENNTYVIKSSESQNTYNINKDSYLIEQISYPENPSTFYTVDFSEISDEVFNIDFNKLVENNKK